MMDIDELSYNVFYLLLRNEHRKIYDFALTKCWTICVPCGDSLREVPITKEFIDDHILKPVPDKKSHYISSDENEAYLYKIENNYVISINDDGSNVDSKVKILSVEKGYNKEFQPYNIIIVDKPLNVKYRTVALKSTCDNLHLNRTISSYKEAVEFLLELPSGRSCPIDDLTAEAEGSNINEESTIQDLKESLQTLIRDYWANTMRKQSLDIQRDARFQKLLSVSLEIFVIHRLHDSLYSLCCRIFEKKDSSVKQKIDQLIDVGVSPDQLGVRESLSVSMPSAIVELATLDSHKGPLEKLMCLKGTLDFIVAEIKGVIADARSKSDDFFSDDDNMKNYAPDTEDLIPLLLYIIIKCRCQRLYTDLFYIENFVWSMSPYDSLSYTLVTFKAALSLLDKISVNDLPKSNSQEKAELKRSELSKVLEDMET